MPNLIYKKSFYDKKPDKNYCRVLYRIKVTKY